MRTVFLLPLCVLLVAAGQDPVKPQQKDVQDLPKAQQKDEQDIPKAQPKDEKAKEVFKELIQKAQEEYRLFFNEPKIALDYWAAASFEIQVGKFDIAAYHIDKLLGLPEKERDEDLLKIEEAEGLKTFFRLRQVKEWSKNPTLESAARKNIDVLIEQVLAVLEKHLSDRDRINRFIEGLHDRKLEVRDYSLYQLMRAKHRAAPAMAEALRKSNPVSRTILKNALLALDPDIMPPLLELYRARTSKEASEDVALRLDLLWLAKARSDKRVIPYLWHLTSASQYPNVVRDAAKDTLAYLLQTTPDRLPPAKIALTQLAEEYYQYKVRWPDVVEVADRDNPAKQIPMPAYKKWYLNDAGDLNSVPVVLKPDDARFEFGLRYARQALELDKAYLPAQAVMLAFLVESDFAGKPFDGQLDRLLTAKPAPAMQRLLAQIDIDVLTAALERAMAEQNYPVMLSLIDAAGERGEHRLAQPGIGNSPGLLVRLLYYPDRRVQFAAARALLNMPAAQTPVASTRIVEVLGRFLASESASKILVAFTPDDQRGQIRQAAKEAGYDTVFVGNIKEAMRLLRASADYEAILIDESIPRGELPFVLSQFRADQDIGRLPLLLITTVETQLEMAALAARTRNTFVLPSVSVSQAVALKKQIDDVIKFAAAPEQLRKAPPSQRQWLDYEVRRGQGQGVSDVEKKRFARDALDWFAQMARGELPGYDLIPAKAAFVHALNHEDLAPQALRVIGRLPLAEAQQRLATTVLDAKKTNLHLIAAQELNRHIQKNGLALNADQISLLRQLEQMGDGPPELRAELALLIGALRTTPQMTGSRLLDFSREPDQKK